MMPSGSLLFSPGQTNPSTLEKAFSHLSPTEQIRLLVSHPYFTGRCPHCRRPIPLSQAQMGQCTCSHCGWQDRQI
ncbi:hypothetical protein L3556_14075 [Candidatus Synechococcus calcipolaris G9]|uniref:Transposase zinc-ribbon domain-containing protein n=1 Tax=Candidatus Synechococcus calcipolaris G9 TaxID=1497997 RepID=A0ABT6F2H9_9SYNE|nr:hypothetical protein [Candidatus Synechococcus calcipolaris]MDG2992048.1 hypothetical protein [Candidatus Synechococcus calcipolaris G9]